MHRRCSAQRAPDAPINYLLSFQCGGAACSVWERASLRKLPASSNCDSNAIGISAEMEMFKWSCMPYVARTLKVHASISLLHVFHITLIQCFCKESFLIAHTLTKLLVMMSVCVMPVSQASQRARLTATYMTTVESCSRANHIRWSAFINFKASWYL